VKPLVKFILAVALALSPIGLSAGGDYEKPDLPHSAHAVRRMEPTFSVTAGIHGDVFPAFANYASLQSPDQRNWSVVSVKVSNSSSSEQRYRISVRVPGWSDEEIQVVNVAAASSHNFSFAPSFFPRLYSNHEIAAATAQIKITDLAGNPVYHATVPLRLRAAEDMLWGAHFEYAKFIASWVTPHDPRVEEVLTKAKELMPGRRLPGYEDWKDARGQEIETRLQAKAIYLALQRQRLSYVKSSLTFGANAGISERIRTPRESIRESSANCIDGSVLFASAFENLAMDPVIVLVPGHAYVGVKLSEKADDYLYIDSSLTGRVSFDAAVNIAQRALARYQASQIDRISIHDARQAGIYPMPQLQ
jgi:hypothetical protein